MISVLIPYASTAGRDANLELTVQRLSADLRKRGEPFEVVLGETTGAWSKGAAVANALERSSGDVLVVHDADVIVEDGLSAAIDNCVTWAVPHLTVKRLSPAATEALHAGHVTREYQRVHKGFLGGGVTVVKRDIYESCPIDPRFEGWGQEDESWALALTTLHGTPWRGESDLTHLWHPPQDRLNARWGSTETMKLYQRYNKASCSPVEMRALLDEVSHGSGTHFTTDRSPR